MEPIFVQYDEEKWEHNNPLFALSEWQQENEDLDELSIADDLFYAIIEDDRKNHQ